MDTMYHIVMVNAWARHRDPKFWNDPLNFKLKRFENVETESYKYKLLPFRVGKRSCLGENLFRCMVSLTLGSLIQCFEWKQVSEEVIDMAEGDGLIMPKVKPLVVK
ncbi:Cytochrome P450 superfamily protein, putative [Theobroma cacao]|uniref:Cytochrome P450 superfamily protein, putative n=1 Tax=Theobroma cacao TaxID=3641 RepID=A0A061E2P8_THECC|nr:Cytochrome P450 superfamily protein, putative [Theobroma cacao]